MADQLHLSDKLSLPLSAATQTFGFFGRKGSGKTYAAGKLAEVLLKARIQVVVLDPVGNWFGLRLDKTGKRPSQFNLPILGGAHGDVPLAPEGGQLVADFVVNTGSSAVIDVSQFRKGDRKDFVTDFAEQLFHRKKASHTPMHFILEEAQVFAPQKIFKGDGARMLGALEDIVRLGRNYGIGVSMISQRPQSVNTELRNQCEPLVVFQLVAKHERKAVGEWMEHMGVDTDLEALSKLATGECFFWSPAWLDKFVRTVFLPKETFDASATPEIGRRQHDPGKLAPVDLKVLHASMSEAIEKAKADDPKSLQLQIKQLQKELEEAKRYKPNGKVKEVLVLQPKDLQHVTKAVDNTKRLLTAAEEQMQATAQRMAERFKQHIDRVIMGISAFDPVMNKLRDYRPPVPSQVVTHIATAVARPRPAAAPRIEGDLGKAEQAILLAAYWLRDETPSKPKLAFYADYSSKSSGVDKALSNLRTMGLMEGTRITPAGIAAVGNAPDKPRGAELREWLRRHLGQAENALLDVLVVAYPDKLTKTELAERAKYSDRSSGVDKALSNLRTIEAAQGSDREGGIQASPVFFE